MHIQQSGDQFESQSDQLMTYSFSSHIPSPISTNKKSKRKIQENLTLNIVKPLKTIEQNSTFQINDKFHKRNIYANDGKIIKLGDAIFKSNFQCGNLGQVTQIKGSNTFKITMQKQINSNRNSAWFFFKCDGLKGQVNFIISGFTKSSSLYTQGMKVCCRQTYKDQTYSYQNNDLDYNPNAKKSNWHRGGIKILYAESYDPLNEENSFQLKFTYHFITNFDTNQYPAVQFAYCYPYEYKRINYLVKNLVKQRNVTYESLGNSYEGREIPLLTIGNPKAQKSIVLSARVHPGETVSSFIMEGFIKELLSQSEFAKSLRRKYLFKIVPMINPDGVVRGNYRFSAAGYDLNRRWKHCYESSHPEIYHLKTMIKKLHRQKKVLMYIDIHGHSRKKSAFFYGCCPSTKDNLSVEAMDNGEQNMSKAKQFPFLMSKLNSNFKYEFCTFNMSKDKQGTARIAMSKQLHIDHVYTLQSSFCSNADGGHNYAENDYLNMGKSLLQGISVYYYEKMQISARQSTMSGSVEQSVNDRKKHQKQNIFDKFLNIRNQAKQELKSSPYLLNLGMNGLDSGSDSQPEAGIIPEQKRQFKYINLDQIQTYESRGQAIDLKQPEVRAKSKSPSFLPINRSIKISIRQPPKKINRLTPQQLKNLVYQKLQDFKTQGQQKSSFQTRIIAKTVNNFYSQNSQQLNSLTADSLMKRNDRVHSKQISSRSMLQKIKGQRMNSENQASLFIDCGRDNVSNGCDQQKKRLQSMTRNLLKSRQGAQYRRARKLAQQFNKKQNLTSSAQHDPIPIVRGIITVTNQLNLSRKKIKTIAPSFYPQSRHNNRRFSVEVPYRNNSNYRSGKIPFQIANRRLSINGDEISVHCKGNKIYI